MMRAGLLKDHIEIHRAVKRKNEFGSEEEMFEKALELRATASQDKPNRTIDNGEIFFPDTVTFWIRHLYENLIFESDRVRWKGKMYRILSFCTFTGDLKIRITAERINE